MSHFIKWRANVEDVQDRSHVDEQLVQCKITPGAHSGKAVNAIFLSYKTESSPSPISEHEFERVADSWVKLAVAYKTVREELVWLIVSVRIMHAGPETQHIRGL